MSVLGNEKLDLVHKAEGVRFPNLVYLTESASLSLAPPTMLAFRALGFWGFLFLKGA